jgi:hypothetical protein
MAAPTSSIFSEIYLQYIENTAIYDILINNHITGYFRYFDDILIYNKPTTNIYDVFNIFNNLMPTMKFTMEKEMDNKISFLDITILNESHSLSFNIYRKHTETDRQTDRQTDTTIPNIYCHSQEHKHAAIRCPVNKMNTYNFSAVNKEKRAMRSNTYHTTTNMINQF